MPAPDSIAAMLDFARVSLGLVAPGRDLVDMNASPLMTAHVWSAIVVGRAVIGGTATAPLVFSGPDVDLQIRTRESGESLPPKDVVTDTLPFGHPVATVVM